MNVIKKVGLLDKIRAIKEAPMMARFTLVTIRRSYNCIVIKPELTTILLMLQDGKYNILVEGHFNKQKQLVVSSFTVRNPDKAAKELGL
ncbi:hypothetical protein [Enterococcus sp. AZ196]|uniref:hypothetical protein n=1 Tax=Enterococcus sp. AZ196 TaxID=2774659 RepID=UPI003D28824A